jgi:anti-sigma factor RsiW
MNDPNDTLSEQLSAYIDGELPEAEARFLQRRLEHDAELRAKWTRMHVVSSCIKGQPWQPMSEGLSTRIHAELAQETGRVQRRPLLRWAVAASIAALAVIFAPGLMQEDVSQPAVVATSATAPDHVLASPASADLIAINPPETAAVAPVAVAATAPSRSEHDLIASHADSSSKASPMPLSAESPADFPLIDSGSERQWPRSTLVGARNDPALEAYLVRHNQMLANDGLGGFVPYVDVVASDPPATARAADEGTDQQ